MNLDIPNNVIIVDPVGYNEFLVLMTNSVGVITDSGTVVEETSVLGIPSLQMRKATERPQTYDSKSSVKFDPSKPGDYPAEIIFKKLSFLSKTKCIRLYIKHFYNSNKIFLGKIIKILP